MIYLLMILIPLFAGVALVFFVLTIGGLFADLVAAAVGWSGK